jgi:hypothetical protein
MIHTGKYEMTDRTAIQRIKELDQERATLFAQATVRVDEGYRE